MMKCKTGSEACENDDSKEEEVTKGSNLSADLLNTP